MNAQPLNTEPLTDRTLNGQTLAALATIADVAHRGAKVTRIDDDGNTIHGVARHLVVDSNGGFLHDGDDVRDAYLRVTSRTGFEHFWPVAELVDLIHAHQFTEYDW